VLSESLVPKLRYIFLEAAAREEKRPTLVTVALGV
jgi:hypothetical protein